jgi:hypothetical protein
LRRRPGGREPSGSGPRGAAAAPSDPEEDWPGRESVDHVVVVFVVVAPTAPPIRRAAGCGTTDGRTARTIDEGHLSIGGVMGEYGGRVKAAGAAAADLTALRA